MSAQPVILTDEAPPALGPVLGKERIEVIDILRGVAIFGILLVNMSAFSMPASVGTALDSRDLGAISNAFQQ